jgi:hypothetical protein
VLPAGVIPVPQLSKVTCAGDPTSNTLEIDIGTADDPDGWADKIVLTNGGQVEATSGVLPVAWLAPTPLVADAGSGNAVVYATVVTASGTPTPGAVLYFTLAFKRAR